MVLMEVAGMGLLALIINVIGAYLLSGNVKRSIFGMEPSEIAQLVQEQSAIMQSIQEGILAINSEGYITACNGQAKHLLELEQIEPLGNHLIDVVQHTRLCSIVMNGPDFIDQPMIIRTLMIVVNRVPVLLNGEVIGAVVTFRDKMQLDQME